MPGGVELPDIRDSLTGKPHRDPPKVVKEAAMEAELANWTRPTVRARSEHGLGPN